MTTTNCTYRELLFKIEDLSQQAKEFARLAVHEDSKESGLDEDLIKLHDKKIKEKEVLYNAMIIAMETKQVGFDNRSIADVEKVIIKLKMQTDTIFELADRVSDNVKNELIKMSTEKISLYMELDATFNKMQQTVIVELEEF